MLLLRSSAYVGAPSDRAGGQLSHCTMYCMPETAAPRHVSGQGVTDISARLVDPRPAGCNNTTSLPAATSAFPAKLVLLNFFCGLQTNTLSFVQPLGLRHTPCLITGGYGGGDVTPTSTFLKAHAPRYLALVRILLQEGEHTRPLSREVSGSPLFWALWLGEGGVGCAEAGAIGYWWIVESG